MAKDYTANIAPALRPLLRDGEQLLVASPLVKDPGTTEDVSLVDELKNLLDPTILLGLGTHPGGLLQQAAFGRAVVGGPGSVARRLFDAVTAATGPAVAVTESRLLIYSAEVAGEPTGSFWQRWFGTSSVEQIAHPVHEVGRHLVAGAVAAPRGALRRGRFLVVLADGSVCALVCALPAMASRAVATIGPPRQRTGADGEGQA